jgi:hypothetical protein
MYGQFPDYYDGSLFGQPGEFERHGKHHCCRVQQTSFIGFGIQHRWRISTFSVGCTEWAHAYIGFQYHSSHHLVIGDKMSETNAENLAWLVKVGQIKDPKAAKPTTTETEE